MKPGTFFLGLLVGVMGLINPVLAVDNPKTEDGKVIAQSVPQFWNMKQNIENQEIGEGRAGEIPTTVPVEGATWTVDEPLKDESGNVIGRRITYYEDGNVLSSMTVKPLIAGKTTVGQMVTWYGADGSMSGSQIEQFLFANDNPNTIVGAMTVTYDREGKITDMRSEKTTRWDRFMRPLTKEITFLDPNNGSITGSRVEEYTYDSHGDIATVAFQEFDAKGNLLSSGTEERTTDDYEKHGRIGVGNREDH